MGIKGVDKISKAMEFIVFGILGRDGISSVVCVIDIGNCSFVKRIVNSLVKCEDKGMLIGGVDGMLKEMLFIECGIFGRDGMCSAV